MHLWAKEAQQRQQLLMETDTNKDDWIWKENQQFKGEYQGYKCANGAQWREIMQETGEVIEIF